MLSVFQKQIKDDLYKVFFNLKEFAAKHKVGDRELTVVVDNSTLDERKAKYAEGTFIGDVLFYVPQVEYGAKPKIGEILKFDNEVYRIFDVSMTDDVYCITLEAVEE